MKSKYIYLPTGIFIKPVLAIWSSYKRLFTFDCEVSTIGQTDSSREDKKKYTFTHNLCNRRDWMYATHNFLERSPLVTGFAVAFLFVQNREVLGPLAGNVFCASLEEFFEGSVNDEPLRAFVFTKTIINSNFNSYCAFDGSSNLRQIRKATSLLYIHCSQESI